MPEVRGHLQWGGGAWREDTENICDCFFHLLPSSADYILPPLEQLSSASTGRPPRQTDRSGFAKNQNGLHQCAHSDISICCQTNH